MLLCMVSGFAFKATKYSRFIWIDDHQIIAKIMWRQLYIVIHGVEYAPSHNMKQ